MELLYSILVGALLHVTSNSFCSVAIIAFAWPRLYEEKQREIDQACKLACDMADTYIQLAISKIPKGVLEKLNMEKKKTQ